MDFHTLGLITNYPPNRAKPVKALERIWPNVRKVLWRKPNTLWLWCRRDLAQSRARGGKRFMRGELAAPFAGWFLALGGRVLVVLKGSSPS